MARKKNVKSKVKKEVQFTDGKSIDPDLESIEEILGNKKPSVFSHASEEDLEEDLNQMNLSDLQELAVRAEVFPSGTKMSLKKKLVKKYRSVTKGGESVTIPYSKPLIDPNSEKGKEALDFLKNEF